MGTNFWSFSFIESTILTNFDFIDSVIVSEEVLLITIITNVPTAFIKNVVDALNDALTPIIYIDDVPITPKNHEVFWH